MVVLLVLGLYTYSHVNGLENLLARPSDSEVSP